jgi:uncharacterized protein (DUF3084 family)
MEINEILTNNPSRIASKAQEAEEARLKFQNYKEELTKYEASKYLTHKAENSKSTISDLKNMIDADDDVYNSRLHSIGLESIYRKLETEVKGLQEELNSAKMIARLKIAEWGTTEGGV